MIAFRIQQNFSFTYISILVHTKIGNSKWVFTFITAEQGVFRNEQEKFEVE